MSSLTINSNANAASTRQVQVPAAPTKEQKGSKVSVGLLIPEAPAGASSIVTLGGPERLADDTYNASFNLSIATRASSNLLDLAKQSFDHTASVLAALNEGASKAAFQEPEPEAVRVAIQSELSKLKPTATDTYDFLKSRVSDTRELERSIESATQENKNENLSGEGLSAAVTSLNEQFRASQIASSPTSSGANSIESFRASQIASSLTSSGANSVESISSANVEADLSAQAKASALGSGSVQIKLALSTFANNLAKNTTR